MKIRFITSEPHHQTAILFAGKESTCALRVRRLLVIAVLTTFGHLDSVRIDIFVSFASVVAVEHFGCNLDLGILL